MMTLQLDPELVAAMAPMAAAFGAKPQFAVGDALGRRQFHEASFAQLEGAFPDIPQVTRKDHTVSTADGNKTTVAEYCLVNTTKDPRAVYYIHGGGFFFGTSKHFEPFIKQRVLQTGVTFFSVDYRLPPEHPDPIPVEDCYAGLQWLSSNAVDLGVDPARIVIMGESAGGGLAAGTALIARDRKLSPPLRKQILFYPMLDDCNNKPIPELAEFSKATWSVEDSITGWGALLGDKSGSSDPKAVSPYAAPARAEDLSGLPPTLIDVGELDILVYENVRYASRLLEAHVPVELHVWPGQIHGFHGFQTTARAASDANVVHAVKGV